MSNKTMQLFRIGITVFCAIFILALSCDALAADQRQKSGEGGGISEVELQAQVMAFADRYFAIIVAAFEAYKDGDPNPEHYRRFLTICTHSVYASFTIAAQSKPVGALLDMVAMVTLGRIVFEENLSKKYGPTLEPLINGFRKSEADIWSVAAKVLSQEQQKKLRDIILDWRVKHPDILLFQSIRFSDFSAYRTEKEQQATGGLFKSVQNATHQVEEARLLAERGMFLGTRMPMLTGLLAGVWFSQLARHPDMQAVLKDMERFSDMSVRLTAVAEQLPDRIAKERDTTIKQAMENINQLTLKAIDETAKRVSLERRDAIDQFLSGLSKERHQIIDDFNREEQRLTGLMSELRLTAAQGNELVVSTHELVNSLGLDKTGAPVDTAKSSAASEPFDIKDYQATLREASNTIAQLHDMIRTIDQMGLEEALPHAVNAINTLEAKGKDWVTLGFLLGLALIVVFLSGSVAALLVYRYLVGKFFEAAPKSDASRPAIQDRR